MWEYPRETPKGDQTDSRRVHGSRQRADHPPPRLLGMGGVQQAPQRHRQGPPVGSGLGTAFGLQPGRAPRAITTDFFNLTGDRYPLLRVRVAGPTGGCADSPQALLENSVVDHERTPNAEAKYMKGP